MYEEVVEEGCGGELVRKKRVAPAKARLPCLAVLVGDGLHGADLVVLGLGAGR